MSLATPVRRRQPLLITATLVCAASMLSLTRDPGAGRRAWRRSGSPR
jgi:hypothetical protein